MELCPKLCGSLNVRVVWGRMNACLRMAESLHGSPETVTTLLISYGEVSQSCRTLKLHGLQPTSLLHPLDFPGNGMGCHYLLHTPIQNKMFKKEKKIKVSVGHTPSVVPGGESHPWCFQLPLGCHVPCPASVSPNPQLPLWEYCASPSPLLWAPLVSLV